MYMKLYLVEIILTIIANVIAFVALKRKNSTSKQLKKVCVTIFGILIISLGITFLLEKPELQLNKDILIQLDSKDVNIIPKTTYHFHDITDKVEVVGKINLNKVGEYKINYKIPTIFGEYTKYQEVRVIDTISPEIVLNGKEECNLSYSKEYKEPGYKATDQHDGDLTKKVQIEKRVVNDQETDIAYKVSDSSGNVTEKIRKIYIIDDVAPVITLNGSSDTVLLIGEQYEEKGAKAIDEKDGDLTSNIKQEGNVDTSKEGNYKITYKVSDSKGNEATKVRNVYVVKEKIKPNTGENGAKGIIYLTFDDGPSTSITPKILDILKKKNVKATFFILNYSSAGEKLVKREVAEGHTVGIHGYSHDYKKIYKSVDTYMENITKLQSKIEKSTGYHATITRFPGGSSNTISRYNPGIMTKLCLEVPNRGFKYFDWNVTSGDAGDVTSTKEVYNNVTKGLSKSRANVVLMHDFSGNTKTLNALENIINYGLKNGYRFEKITDDTPMVTHKVNN